MVITPKGYYSDGLLLRRVITPKGYYSEKNMRVITPRTKGHYSERKARVRVSEQMTLMLSDMIYWKSSDQRTVSHFMLSSGPSHAQIIVNGRHDVIAPFPTRFIESIVFSD